MARPLLRRPSLVGPGFKPLRENEPLKRDGHEFIGYFGRSRAMGAHQQLARLAPASDDPLAEQQSGVFLDH